MQREPCFVGRPNQPAALLLYLQPRAWLLILHEAAFG
jgi:hypothetical protein